MNMSSVFLVTRGLWLLTHRGWVKRASKGNCRRLWPIQNRNCFLTCLSWLGTASLDLKFRVRTGYCSDIVCFCFSCISACISTSGYRSLLFVFVFYNKSFSLSFYKPLVGGDTCDSRVLMIQACSFYGNGESIFPEHMTRKRCGSFSWQNPKLGKPKWDR